MRQGNGAKKPLLSLRSVSKFFGALAAVDNLSFDVFEGEVLGIGGPNGAGKTTLFDIVSGLAPASAGQVLLADRDITRQSPESICHAGVARTFQLNASFETLTVFENVMVGAYFGHDNRAAPGVRSDDKSLERAEHALDRVGLTNKRHLVAGRLPVLDRKLLMLAGALATQPRLLLMDEPVGGLSPHEMDAVSEILRAIVASGVTIVLIEHVMRFLVQLSTRVLILHHGEQIFNGLPLEVFSNPAVIDVYLGEGAASRLREQFSSPGPP